MINLQDHELEVRELFNTLTLKPLEVTADLPGLEHLELRVITYDGFKTAIERMMNKAYFYGNQDGFKQAEAIVDEVFTMKI